MINCCARIILSYHACVRACARACTQWVCERASYAYVQCIYCVSICVRCVLVCMCRYEVFCVSQTNVGLRAITSLYAIHPYLRMRWQNDNQAKQERMRKQCRGQRQRSPYLCACKWQGIAATNLTVKWRSYLRAARWILMDKIFPLQTAITIAISEGGK